VHKTRITIATHRLLVIRRRRIVQLWCAECGRDSEFVPVEDLNGLLGDGAGTCSEYQSPKFHFAKAQDGAIVAGIRSLSAGDSPKP